MELSFDINKIVKYLEKFKLELPELYKWNANITRLVELEILTNQQVEELNQLTPYLKEIQLKKIVGKKLNESYSNNSELFDKLSVWIIKDWGGIKASNNDEISKLIEVFLNNEKPDFKRIASSSKVGSYLYPHKNIIYDSRVAYSLNWIILSENAGSFYFPIPEGRNSKMRAFDLNVLIRLKNLSNYQVSDVNELNNRLFIKKADSELFINERIAYYELNKLISQVHKILWKDEPEKIEHLYYTEMILFSIADREIFKDITDSLVLNINFF
ncbi:hypothetical protein [Empedobacter brevis]|uniref:hypothetical protein n=1 Tax=Empedobacter brevis TaxID=247 RepID=UPI002FE26DEA